MEITLKWRRIHHCILSLVSKSGIYQSVEKVIGGLLGCIQSAREDRHPSFCLWEQQMAWFWKRKKARSLTIKFFCETCIMINTTHYKLKYIVFKAYRELLLVYCSAWEEEEIWYSIYSIHVMVIPQNIVVSMLSLDYDSFTNESVWSHLNLSGHIWITIYSCCWRPCCLNVPLFTMLSCLVTTYYRG